LDSVDYYSGADSIDLESGSSPKSPALIAYENGTLGFGFSAGGLLFPYYLGVVSELRAMGILTDDTPVAGASAGSLIAACSKSGLGTGALKDALTDLAAQCRRLGTRHNLGPVLEGVLREVLPQDMGERATACNVHVAVTHVLPQPKPVLVSSYEGRDDLISALLTSCHIPWYFDGRLTTTFRGVVACDGGLTNFLPAPTGATHTVRVCCFPSSALGTRLGRLCITPDSYERWPHDMRAMLGWAFEPAPEPMMLSLIDKGARDARAWATREGVAQAAAAAALQHGVLAAAGRQLLG